MYLIRNKRTKDFIDNSGDWTLVRSFAKRFTSKDEAQKFIDKHQTKNDDPYMEIVSEDVQKHLKEYLKEATMSDIPHEIDDQIHKLKDMRFDLEETQKNWDLAGMDTTPLSDIINEINKLIEVMYSKGANLANQTIKEEAHYFPKEEIAKLVRSSRYNWNCISSAQGYSLWETKIMDKAVRIAHEDNSSAHGGYDTVYLFDNKRQKEEKEFKTFTDAFKYAENLLNKIYKEN